MEDRQTMLVPFGEVTLRHVRFSLSHFCDGSAGLKSAAFGFAVRGETRLDSDLGKLSIPRGGFFALPRGLRYRSHWQGSPEIEYIMVHLSSWSGGRFLPVCMESLSNEKTLGRLLRAEKDLGGSLPDRLAALSDLFDLFSRAAAHFTPAPDAAGNPAVQAAADFIRAHFRENYSAAELAAAACVSESHLYHLFKKELQISPLEFRNEIRVEEAARLLSEKETDTREILAATGFSSDVYFREVFKKYRGVTPGEYRRQIIAAKNDR